MLCSEKTREIASVLLRNASIKRNSCFEFILSFCIFKYNFHLYFLRKEMKVNGGQKRALDKILSFSRYNKKKTKRNDWFSVKGPLALDYSNHFIRTTGKIPSNFSRAIYLNLSTQNPVTLAAEWNTHFTTIKIRYNFSNFGKSSLTYAWDIM